MSAQPPSTATRDDTGPGPVAVKPVSAPARSRTWDRISSFGMVGVLILLVIVATILKPSFLNPQNLVNVLSQNAPVGLIAVGMTFVIIAGGFDLSVAAILAAGGVAYASFSTFLPIPLALLLSAVLGFLLGCLNAFLITKARVNAFIATLATASLIGGATQLYTNSKPVPLADGGYDFLHDQKFLGAPLSVWLLAVFVALGWFVLARTVYGRGIYSIGGNNEAARLAGLRVNLLRSSTYAITGMCAALAGVLVASVIGVGQPGTAVDVTLNSIAIVIIGGTSLLGGEGAMWRTVVGLLIFGTINNVFDILALPQAAQDVALGVIVIGAVSLDAYTRSKKRSGKA